jgi:uncharacterized Zn finger protein
VRFREYGPTIRVEGGLRAKSTRGDIGESWWSRRFISVLEELDLGGRLARGRSYARAGQVLSLEIRPGEVTSQVQGSRPQPYEIRIALDTFPEATWKRIEAALAAQAIFAARLLAGDMPHDIEKVFRAAKAPLFPTSASQLQMQCNCPDWSVPCKHVAATIYLLAEAFDADPFEILHWRGRSRDILLEHLRQHRDGKPAPRRRRAVVGTATRTAIGAAAALIDLTSPDLQETVERFWVPPVPLPARPPTLDTATDLVLRQLSPPPPTIGGAELASRLRTLYTTLAD